MKLNFFSLPDDVRQRVFGLDVLRAIAILIVVDAHATHARGQFYEPLMLRYFLPDGVELFFVLSGFLIGGILIRIYEKGATYGPADVLHFWKRRWFRTLPAYYLVLTVLVALYTLTAKLNGQGVQLPHGRGIVRYYVFLQNFTAPVPGFFPETWSLAIEEWSYITLPLLLLLFHYVAGGRWPKQRIVLIVILLLIVGTNIGRLLRALDATTELETRDIVLTRLDAIAYGVLAAYVKHYAPAFWRNRPLARLLLIVGVILVGLVALSASPLALHYYYVWGVKPHYAFYKNTYYWPLIGLTMTLLLPFMDGWRQAGRVWQRSGLAAFITHVSLISYSMYLLNLSPIMGNIIEHIPTTSAAVGWGKVALFWALVLSLSTLLYKYYEKPMTNLREL